MLSGTLPAGLFEFQAVQTLCVARRRVVVWCRVGRGALE